MSGEDIRNSSSCSSWVYESGVFESSGGVTVEPRPFHCALHCAVGWLASENENTSSSVGYSIESLIAECVCVVCIVEKSGGLYKLQR